MNNDAYTLNVINHQVATERMVEALHQTGEAMIITFALCMVVGVVLCIMTYFVK